MWFLYLLSLQSSQIDGFIIVYVRSVWGWEGEHYIQRRDKPPKEAFQSSTILHYGGALDTYAHVCLWKKGLFAPVGITRLLVFLVLVLNWNFAASILYWHFACIYIYIYSFPFHTAVYAGKCIVCMSAIAVLHLSTSARSNIVYVVFMHWCYTVAALFTTLTEIKC